MHRFLVVVVALSLVLLSTACSDGASDDPQEVMEAYFRGVVRRGRGRIMTYVAPDASLKSTRPGPSEMAPMRSGQPSKPPSNDGIGPLRSATSKSTAIPCRTTSWPRIPRGTRSSGGALRRQLWTVW